MVILKQLSSDSDDNEMKEEEHSGLAAKMVRQLKLMKQKSLMEDMEDMEDDEEEEEKKQRVTWGRGKKIYYGSDNVNYENTKGDSHELKKRKASKLEMRSKRRKSIIENTANGTDVDEYYKQAKLVKGAKKGSKQAKYPRKILSPVKEDDNESKRTSKRSISWQMEKNRGLTPHRKKADKNPRKKYKLKHEKAVTRRKGQVRDIRAATTNYGGEASGIRTDISHSIRFRN